MTRLSHFSFQMFWLLFTTNYGTLQLDYILAIVGAGHHSFLWTKTTTNCGVIHNLVSLCDDAIYSWFFFIMQLDYILAIVVSGHNSFLWTKATTFLKSQRAICWVHQAQSIVAKTLNKHTNLSTRVRVWLSWMSPSLHIRIQDYFIKFLSLMWKCWSI